MPDQLIDELQLRNGERILVRPIRPADAGQLAALHTRLSSDSVYRRYFGVKHHLSPAEVRRFTSIDKEWRFALAGLRHTGQLVAVARYEGERDSTDAEIALIVDDALQHLGAGTALLRRLIDVGRVSGLESLSAVVLRSNTPMLHLLLALPVPAATAYEGDSVVVTLDLTGLEMPADRSRVAAAHVAEMAAIRMALDSPR